ncbi:hypothetical protein SAMN04487905_10653 [Actinopolyspora xinjiangensis]|uniref:Uncharacterized protein n=1 Tax=Actinopolyspora xinjiangensis TaxID=405564 RepID=A0A1H0U4Z4_9ACTN|nr:hypothetical protein [Actinopolyspora xinjiangensis]SDP61244.1 hypothetical protein SAMN04487905_10653 [Actinopolyspora xinjiangensis]
MPWFAVDDQLADNKKARKAGTAALGLWVRCGSWAAAHLTDGFVPADIVTRYGTTKQAEKLVQAGLWEHAESDGESGYQFHDWFDYQRSAEQVRSERAGAAKRKQRSRNASDGNDTTNEGSNGGSNDGRVAPENDETKTHEKSEKPQDTDGCHGVSHTVSHGPPIPSHPIPTEGARTRARTRAPDHLLVTPDMRQWADRSGIRCDLDAETETFLDYHRAKGATFKDWHAAWRNWMKNTLKYGGAPKSDSRKPNTLRGERIAEQ